MADRIRYHLDEHIATAVAIGLRARGIDVTTTDEAGLRAADDDEQLAFAHAAGRVLVTHDADFLRMHDEGREHAGIVYSPQQHTKVGDLIRGLVLIHTVLTAAEMHNHVEFI